MKTIFTLLLTLSLAWAASGQNTWTAKANFPESRQLAAAFVIGTKAYMGMGYGSSNADPKALWEFDPVANTYTQKATYPGISLQGNIAFAINGKGYLGMGVSSTYQNDFYEYNPVTNTWAAKANFPGTARSSAACFAIDGKGYVGTGTNTGTTYFNDFWQYDPATNVWTQKNNFPGSPRWGVTAFSIGSKGYFCLGQAAGYMNYDLYEYNTVTGIWTQKADFKGYGRGHAVGFSINGLGYVGTGYDYTSARRKDFWQYNPANDCWVQKADVGGLARETATGFAIGRKGFIGLGSTGAPVVNDVWEYLGDSLQASYNTTFAACAGATIPVSILTGVTFNPGNVFTVQLSNLVGSFSTPTNLTTIIDTAGSIILATIPAATPAGVGYRVRVISSNPVVVGANNGVNFTIQPQTVPTLSIGATSTTSVCSGTPVTFTATATNQGTAMYHWKVNGSTIVSSLAGYLNHMPSNGDVITCMMVISDPCVSQDTLISNAITMTVIPKVTPSITINALSTAICLPDSVRATAAITNGGTSPTYQWQINSSNVVGNNTLNLRYIPANGDIIKCIISSSLACLNSNNVQSNQLSIATGISVTPSISISGPTNTLCIGDTAHYSANTTFGGTAPSFQWLVNNVVAGTNTASYTYVPANGDVVKCDLTSNQQCATTNILTSNSLTTLVSPQPSIPIITQNGATLSTGLYSNYQWYLNGTAIASGGNGQSIVIQQNGNYSVVVNNTGSCKVSSANYSFGNLAVGSNNLGSDIFVYPNPAGNKLFIKSPINVDAQLIDLTGRIMLSKNSAESLDLISLAQGIYQLKLTSASRVFVTQIVIIR